MDSNNRRIKFRAWDKDTKKMYPVAELSIEPDGYLHGLLGGETDERGLADLGRINFHNPSGRTAGLMQNPEDGDLPLMQYTGLLDKNGDKEVYECDIIDSQGTVIGNEYETPALLKDEANLLIQGFGTGTWLTTYSQAVERGCKDA